MVRRCLAFSLLLGIFAVSLTRPCWAETLVQQNVDTRVVLAFRVGHAGLQRWLPAPRQVDPVATGPSKGANLTVSFIDRLLNQDSEGKVVAEPLPQPNCWLLAPAARPNRLAQGRRAERRVVPASPSHRRPAL